MVTESLPSTILSARRNDILSFHLQPGNFFFTLFLDDRGKKRWLTRRSNLRRNDFLSFHCNPMISLPLQEERHLVVPLATAISYYAVLVTIEVKKVVDQEVNPSGERHLVVPLQLLISLPSTGGTTYCRSTCNPMIFLLLF